MFYELNDHVVIDLKEVKRVSDNGTSIFIDFKDGGHMVTAGDFDKLKKALISLNKES